MTDSLRKVGDQRPTKPAKLRRSLKSFLGKDSTDKAVKITLGKLVAEGVVKMDPVKGTSYPRFSPATGPGTSQV